MQPKYWLETHKGDFPVAPRDVISQKHDAKVLGNFILLYCDQ